MIINILLPYKEKFSKNKASSVSLTVSNNLQFTKYKKNIRVFGHNVKEPMHEKNFIGFENSWNIFKSKNENIAQKMCEFLNNEKKPKQIIEVHNRPYLINLIHSKLYHFHNITLFLHNDPLEMKGSISINERKNLISKLNKIYCVSNFIKKRFLIGITDHYNKVVVLHNGVKRVQNFKPNKQKQIIFVGRIVKEKGVDLFVDSIKEIYNDFKDWDFKIIGSPKLGVNKFDNFSKKIKMNFEGLGKRAKMLGFVNSKSLNKIMQKSSIIVIPSIWQEPFGLVAAEAMSNGVAIISSKNGGLPEIIGKNGILIENINAKKITKNLKKFMENENLLKQFQTKSWDNFKLNSKIISARLDQYRNELLFKN